MNQFTVSKWIWIFDYRKIEIYVSKLANGLGLTKDYATVFLVANEWYDYHYHSTMVYTFHPFDKTKHLTNI